jgi:hypothetical protein
VVEVIDRDGVFYNRIAQLFPLRGTGRGDWETGRRGDAGAVSPDGQGYSQYTLQPCLHAETSRNCIPVGLIKLEGIEISPRSPIDSWLAMRSHSPGHIMPRDAVKCHIMVLLQGVIIRARTSVHVRCCEVLGQTRVVYPDPPGGSSSRFHLCVVCSLRPEGVPHARADCGRRA